MKITVAHEWWQNRLASGSREDSKSKTPLQRRGFLAHVIACGAATGAALSVSGCGTLLHKERINQPHSRDLDWKMVALNGLGLILFFIPGVIAFVVDFHTGAIYLPAHPIAMKPSLEPSQAIAEPASHADTEPARDRGSVDGVTLTKFAVDSSELNLATIEREVTHHVGAPISLNDSASRVTQLENLDEFATARQRHEADHTFGISPKQFFQRVMGWRRLDPDEP